jgi:hypothetical protein
MCTRHPEDGTCGVPQNAGELITCATVSAGNTFQDLPQLRETADNTERYI